MWPTILSENFPFFNPSPFWEKLAYKVKEMPTAYVNFNPALSSVAEELVFQELSHYYGVVNCGSSVTA